MKNMHAFDFLAALRELRRPHVGIGVIDFWPHETACALLYPSKTEIVYDLDTPIVPRSIYRPHNVLHALQSVREFFDEVFPHLEYDNSFYYTLSYAVRVRRTYDSPTIFVKRVCLPPLSYFALYFIESETGVTMEFHNAGDIDFIINKIQLFLEVES